MKIDILRLIAEDRSLIIYRPTLRPICGGITGVLLFHQILYWWQKNERKPFYKFRNVCNHPGYKKGDSWCEELGFSERELDHAIDLICEKIKRKDLPAALEKSNKMVLFWTDINRQTWFIVNENAAEKAISSLYTVSAETAFTVSAEMGITKPTLQQFHTAPYSSFETAERGNRNTEITTKNTTKTTTEIKEKEDGAKKPAPIPVEIFEHELVEENPQPLKAQPSEKEKICAKKEKAMPEGFGDFRKAYEVFYSEKCGLVLGDRKADTDGLLEIFKQLKGAAKIKNPNATEDELPAIALKSLNHISKNWGNLSNFHKESTKPKSFANNLPGIMSSIRNGNKQNKNASNERGSSYPKNTFFEGKTPEEIYKITNSNVYDLIAEEEAKKQSYRTPEPETDYLALIKKTA
jgi:hypothetical protein